MSLSEQQVKGLGPSSTYALQESAIWSTAEGSPGGTVPLFVSSEAALSSLARGEDMTPATPILDMTAFEQGVWLATSEGAFFINNHGETRSSLVRLPRTHSGGIEYVWQTAERLWTVSGSQLCLHAYPRSSNRTLEQHYCQALKAAPDGLSQVVPLDASCSLAVTRDGKLLQLSLGRDRWEERMAPETLGTGWQAISLLPGSVSWLWGVQAGDLVGMQWLPASSAEGGCPPLDPQPKVRIALGRFANASLLRRWRLLIQRTSSGGHDFWVAHSNTLKHLERPPQEQPEEPRPAIISSLELLGELNDMVPQPVSHDRRNAILLATTVWSKNPKGPGATHVSHSQLIHVDTALDPHTLSFSGDVPIAELTGLLWNEAAPELLWLWGNTQLLRCQMSERKCQAEKTRKSLFHNSSLTAMWAAHARRIWWADSSGSLLRLDTAPYAPAEVRRCEPPSSSSPPHVCWPQTGKPTWGVLERTDWLWTMQGKTVCRYPLNEQASGGCPDWTKGEVVRDHSEEQGALPWGTEGLRFFPGRNESELLMQLGNGLLRTHNAHRPGARPSFESLTLHAVEGVALELSKKPSTSLAWWNDALWGVAGDQLFCNEGPQLERACRLSWPKSEQLEQQPSRFRALAARRAGGLWLADRNGGLWRLTSGEGETLQLERVAHSEWLERLEHLWEDEQERVWIQGRYSQDREGMSLYSDALGMVDGFALEHGLRGLSLPMATDAEGRLWLKEGMTRLSFSEVRTPQHAQRQQVTIVVAILAGVVFLLAGGYVYTQHKQRRAPLDSEDLKLTPSPEENKGFEASASSQRASDEAQARQPLPEVGVAGGPVRTIDLAGAVAQSIQENQGAKPPMNSVEQELKRVVESKSACLVLGAGISIQTSGNAPTASWLGLLKNGIDRCVDLGKGDQNWKDRQLRALEANETDELLGVAHQVAQKLGAPTDGIFASWLGSTVGKLEVHDSTLIETLAALRLPILTTNYDELIEKVTRRKGLTSAKVLNLQQLLQGNSEAGVYHIHGIWDDSATVVLSLFDYRDAVKDPELQNRLHSLATTKSLIFVGCGDGLKDPNLGSLVKWIGNTLRSATHPHFILAREFDAKGLRERYKDIQGLRILSYGPDFTDLVPYLKQFQPSSAGV